MKKTILKTLTTLAVALVLIAPLAMGDSLDVEPPIDDTIVVPTGNDDDPLVCGADEMDPWVDACGDRMLGDLEMKADVVFVADDGSHYPMGLIPAQDVYRGGNHTFGASDNNTLDSENHTVDLSGHTGLGFDGTAVCLADLPHEGCGSITAVLPGWGLTGGGNKGSVSLDVDPAMVQTRIAEVCDEDHYLQAIEEDGAVLCDLDNDTTYTPGHGLELDNSTFLVNTTLLQSRIDDACTDGQFMHTIHENGTVLCRADQDTTYTAGTALILDSEDQFNVDVGMIRSTIRGTCPSGQFIYSIDSGSGRCRPQTRGTCSQGFFARTIQFGSVACDGGWSTRGNPGTNPDFNFIGTLDNTNLTFRVNDARALVIQPGDTPNLIGGHEENHVEENVIGATIGGGGSEVMPNRVLGDWGTVAGGENHTADGIYSTIGGGLENTAGGTRRVCTASSGWLGCLNWEDLPWEAATVSGGQENSATSDFATVGGGKSNTASGLRSTVGGGSANRATNDYATIDGGSSNTASGSRSAVGGGFSNRAAGGSSTVGGGSSNTASDWYGTVGGGSSNEATGRYSTVPGGQQNEANGLYSFAAGRLAKADHSGAFVWRDGVFSGGDFHSTANNQFSVRAVGGVQFKTNTDLSTGCSLPPGGGSWSCTSDRDAKENWQEVDSQDVLKRLTGVPVATWNYHSQDEDVVHMGPAAQDFHAAFGLGEDEKSISQVDSAGVAFAAIQGLNEVVEEQAKTIEDLEERLQRLEALLEE